MKTFSIKPFFKLVLLLPVFLISGCAGLSGKGEQYVFYPPLPSPPRIQYLASFSGPQDLVEGGNTFSEFVLGKESETSTIVKKPYGVQIHDGVIYAVDIRGPGVAMFDLKTRKFDLMYGAFSGKMRKPINIRIDKDGTKYITDTIRNLVLVYNAENKYERLIGDGESFKPSDLLIVDDNLFVTDIKNHKIRVMNKYTGRELYNFGKAGSKEGELFYPTNLALGPNGNIYVSETGNFRVQEFTPQGDFVKTFGKVGTGLGQFARPKGIAVDKKGRLYVVDAAFENVQIMNEDGRLLMYFGEPGSEKANINLPTGIAIDYDNIKYFKKYAAPGFKIHYIILVASQFGLNKVNVFAYGRKEGLDYSEPVQQVTVE